MSKEAEKLNQIIRRHYPNYQFDDCRASCMACGEHECVDMETSRDSLESDIQEFVDQKTKELRLKLNVTDSALKYRLKENKELRQENKNAIGLLQRIFDSYTSYGFNDDSKEHSFQLFADEISEILSGEQALTKKD